MSQVSVFFLVLCKRSPRLPFSMYSYTKRLVSFLLQQHKSFTMCRCRMFPSVFTYCITKQKDRLSKYLTLLSTLVAGTTCHLTLKTSHLHCLHIILKNLSNVRPPANMHLEWESIYTLSTYLTCLCIYKKHSFNVKKHFTQT